MDLTNRVQAIIQKTYLEHGFRSAPWGIGPGSPSCSYEAGCAIGLSTPKDLAREMDAIGDGIDDLLRHVDVRRELLGTDEETPEWVGNCLSDVQAAHDDHALASTGLTDEELRDSYQQALTDIATHYGLTLTSPWEAA